MQFHAKVIPFVTGGEEPGRARFKPPDDAVNVSTQLFPPSGAYSAGALVVSWIELTPEERREMQYAQAVGNGQGKLIT